MTRARPIAPRIHSQGKPTWPRASRNRSTRECTATWLGWLASQQTFWVTLAAIVAFVVLSLASDVFATQQNLFNVTRNFAFVAIIAIGMTAVIITGGIDLSVGAVLVLSGMVIGMTMNAGMSIWLADPARARRVAAGRRVQRAS